MISKIKKPAKLLFVLAFLCIHSPCCGQEDFAGPMFLELDGKQVKIRRDQYVEMVVSPAKVQLPALHYRLYPSPSSLKKGDASTFYHRAMIRIYAHRRTKNFRQNEELRRLGQPVAFSDQSFAELSDLIQAKLEARELNELKNVIARENRTLFSELQTATKLSDCDWGFDAVYDKPLGEYIGFLVPEMQELRTLARFLALKAKVEIAEGRFDDAIETIRAGFKMSKATEDTRFVICSLIGIACANHMLEMVQQCAEQPDAPNLYWALATLPKPLINVRPAMVHELEFVRNGAGLSILQDPENQDMTPEQWNKAFQKDLTGFEMTGSRPSQGTLGLLALRSYPIAKRELIERGMSAKRVAGMPAAQVIAIHQSRTQKVIADELLKYQNMDYATIKQQMAKLARKKPPAGANSPQGNLETRELIPVTSMLLPSMSGVIDAEIRLQRRIAMLQTIEAIRYHAAVNGQLPKTLSEIQVVPIPREPITGKPFRYLKKNDGFQLWEMAPDESILFANSKIIQIRLRK